VRRASECAARYGGEEFAVLLPGLSAEQAFTVAETIRCRVAQLPADPIVLTVSIGVASLTPTAALNFTGLVEAADKALYAAKAAGRNRSVVASVAQLALVA
jgi:diguanylate cyclase (GGDEF)-like protein